MSDMKVLVIGSGGREHALAWKAAQSPRISRVFVAPGNPGTAREAKIHNIAIGATDVEKLLAFAQSENIDLTIVGPEAPLAAGVVDAFRAAGKLIFGPHKFAAQLESSKAFAKDFLKRHGIPTARYETFTDIVAAKAYVEANGAPIVIKADGLAAGKGVIVAMTRDEAFAAIDDMLSGNKFGSAGSRVVIEEFLAGEEASFIVMVDGHNVIPMATSQDHKRRDDGDKGPNTGGMGAYSPAPVVTRDVHDRVMREIIRPTVDGMNRDGHPYVGFLYAGLMINEHGEPKVIEFNCRFGDPETQPIMMRLQSDLVSLCEAGARGQLNAVSAEWDSRVAVGVVLAAANYPDDPRKGDVIHGLDAQLADAKLFHAGTAEKDGAVVTAGGRVLCATALGYSVQEAQQRAYELAGKVSWSGMFCRRDIGWRAIARES